MDAFTVVKGNDFKVGRKYEDENFKFEDGKVYNSSMSHSREVGIGELKTTLETYVVDANISLLLGMDYLKKWVVIIDTGKREDAHRKSNQSLNIDASKSSFWKLPIWIGRTLYRQAQRLVLNVGIGQMKVRNLRKHMVKTHMNLVYNSGSHMTRLCQMDGRVDRKSWKPPEMKQEGVSWDSRYLVGLEGDTSQDS